MARPPKEDREAVKGAVLAVRLSPAERSTLERLVRARADELARLAGQPIEVTAASYIRWLLLRDAEARGLAPPRAQAPASCGPQAGAKGATEAPPKPASKAAARRRGSVEGRSGRP